MIREWRPLQAPFIKVTAEIVMNGEVNGKPKIKTEARYEVAPSAKKIATYIVNQLFGTKLITKDNNVNWLMPSLKDALEQAIYCKESFICLHKFDNRVYLETIRPNQIFDLVQKYDKLYSGTIVEYFNEYELHKHFEIENGKTILQLKAFKITKSGDKLPIPLGEYNRAAGTSYDKETYILPYEYIINIDTGEDFFRDSKKFLMEEFKIVNTMAEEIEKTKTKIATTQHFQTGNVVTKWQPNTTYNVRQLDVGELKDYFTLMPGDKDHYIFEYLQGNIRTKEYIETFKFYDYQVIQMSGLSPASFGYEKDAYMNNANVELSADASEMTIETIKLQLEGQINRLFENIAKMQISQSITENAIGENLEWDYGDNERLDDQKKLELLKKLEGVAEIPYKYKARIIEPLLRKLANTENEKEVAELLKARNEDRKGLKVTYGEL